jgi:hypothetical protein
LIQKGLHAPVIGGLIIFRNNTAEYVDTEGASCPGDRGIYLILEIILQNILI